MSDNRLELKRRLTESRHKDSESRRNVGCSSAKESVSEEGEEGSTWLVKEEEGRGRRGERGGRGGEVHRCWQQ
jgi:hypothetical protein